jgi:hypothetical protein
LGFPDSNRLKGNVARAPHESRSTFCRFLPESATFSGHLVNGSLSV